MFTTIFSVGINPPQPTPSKSGIFTDTVGIDSDTPLPSSANGVLIALQTMNISMDGQPYNNAGPVNFQITTVVNGQVTVQLVTVGVPTPCPTCKP